MKRLMTTLIFVLLGWTGFCLADGVTVSGTVTISGGGGAMPFDCLGTSNIFLLDNNGDIVYTGSITQNTSFETVYSIANVASGTYTLKFEGYGGNRVVIYEETSVEVGSEAKTADITLSNSDVKNGTHRAVQFVVVQEGGSTAIAGASVTGTPSTEGAKSISLISDKDGKVTFFFEQTATLSVTAKATAYEDKMLTFDETFSGTFLTENVQIAMKAAAVESVTLSGAITMVPAGDFPADFQIQLTNIRHEYSQTTPVNNQYSFENVPVGEMSDGPSTLEVYDPTEVTGFTEEYTVTTPNRGMFLISNENATFTQNITIQKNSARVRGTIKDVATLGSLPEITLTKEGQTAPSYFAKAIEGGSFTFKKIPVGTYTVGTSLAGYTIKDAPKVTIADDLKDAKLESPLEFVEADMTFTFKATLYTRDNGNYIAFGGAEVKLFAEGADVATATPLATTTASESGDFSLTTTGKLGTKYILYVTHEKIKPCSLAVTATKPIMTNADLTFTFELAPVAIPTPTFTPDRGNVKPGATITFTLPESLDIATTYNDMAFILYVENNATVELKSDVATIMAAITGGIDGGPAAEGAEGDETEPSATLPFKVGMYREGEWLIPVSLSADASGAVVLRAVLAVSEDMETLLYSNEMTATYTVEGEAVKPTAPTFYVDGEAVEAAAAEIAADAVVTLQNGYEEEEATLNPIYYKLNGTDADFEISDATVMMAEDFNALTPYTAGDEIAIDEDMTIKAATAHINVSDMTVTWSDITTVAFTVTGGGEDPELPELPETVAKPTFSVAAGPVDKGTKLTWTWDEAYDEYEGIGVVYVANGTDDAVLNIDFETYGELVDAEEEGTEDGKLYVYLPAVEDGPAELGAYIINKDVTVKARLVIPVLEEPADNEEEATFSLMLSPVATATYTVKGGTTENTVATPTFNPAAGAVDKGTKVTIACATQNAKIYYTVDGSEPTAQSTEGFEVVIDKAMTIKAIAIKGETKSAVASATYTIKTGTTETDTVATPTFNPAAGAVAKGTKVEIACATDSVKIYYTVDGSEPTAQSTEYKAAIEINEALTIKAIAIKGETKSAVASAAYTVKTANEGLALAGVSVYPNPSDGEFQLDLPVAAMVEVFASTGVLRQRVEAGAGVMTLNIDRSGIYFLRITADGRTTVKRVVVR